VDETVGIPGNLLAIAGVEGITIGETVTSAETRCRCRRSRSTSPPSPWRSPSTPRRFPGARANGESRNLRERLDKELLTNVSIRVKTGTRHLQSDGPGRLQLAILIEMMRREGFELMVGKPEILTPDHRRQSAGAGRALVIDCPERFLGVVIGNLGTRKGKMLKMVNHGPAACALSFTCHPAA